MVYITEPRASAPEHAGCAARSVLQVFATQQQKVDYELCCPRFLAGPISYSHGALFAGDVFQYLSHTVLIKVLNSHAV